MAALPSSTSNIPLFVQLNGKTVQVITQECWSILDLKQELCRQSKTPVRKLKVVFAGSELNDASFLKDCQFSFGTVVHAVVVETQNDSNSTTKSMATNFIAPNNTRIQRQNGDSSRKRSMFYIFCKNGCQSVQAGKLRVRCAQCKDEAFEIDKGPDRWLDILKPNRISGKCNSNNVCSGDKAEFFFKCINEKHKESHQPVVALTLLQTNTKNIPCLACTDTCDVVLVFPCTDLHVICLECFAVYCRTKLDSRQFALRENIGYSVTCPGLGGNCDGCYIEEVHHFMIAGSDQYERYKRFATEEFVLSNGGLLCPGEGCSNGIIPDRTETARIVCYRSRGGCGLSFCRRCLAPYHDGPCVDNYQSTRDVDQQSYDVNASNALQSRWIDEVQSRDTINQTTKRCPGCRTPTERSGGCNHMTCSRCAKQWCWLCMVTWGRGCEADHWFLVR